MVIFKPEINIPLKNKRWENLVGENNPSTTAVNLSMNSDSGFPVQLLPDAQGIMYQTKVDIPEEGAEAHLG